MKHHLDSENVYYSDLSIKQYLHNLTKENIIFDAGRGWYSTIEKPFLLDVGPLKNIIEFISNKFPLLQFSCWSTEQIKYYFHHLQAKFVTFIYTEKDFLTTVFESLRSNHNVYLHPTIEESKKVFVIEDETIVMRPAISQEPTHDFYTTIEKLLVDFLIENKKLSLTSESEYQVIFQNIVTQYRINISKLFRYAKRRKVDSELKKHLNIPMSLYF